MRERRGRRALNEKARTRAKAWDADAARRRGGLLLPAGLADRAAWLRRLLSEWVLAEIAPGRLVPWMAVAFGFGIVVYFTADREPAWWAAAALRTTYVVHPVLQFPVSTVTLSGFVEIREERERSDRITVRVHTIEGRRLNEVPERVRLAVRNTAPAVGSFIELKAHLSPPLAPLRPGGYDFARDMYFHRIAASGYALGKIRTAAAPVNSGFWLGYAAVIDGIRETIDKRMRAELPGDEGSIASALITGKRDAISTPVNDATYVSSLAHVLSPAITWRWSRASCSSSSAPGSR